MKTRDSGMPNEDSWATFFEPERLLRDLGLDATTGRVIDIGCGYGTFTIPLAHATGAEVLAIDIDPDLVAQVVMKAQSQGLDNVTGAVRDIAVDGTGEADGSADVVVLFNLLHCEDPLALLNEAFRVLRSGGRVGAIHWRSDIPTPRGPELGIRPRSEAIERWLMDAGFTLVIPPQMLPPFHFGMVGMKPVALS